MDHSLAGTHSFAAVSYSAQEIFMSIDGKHAIIIEDDELNAEILKNLLNKVGIVSTRIDNNADLKQVLCEFESVDIIFVDLEMPGNNGYDVLSILVGCGWTDRVPVVAYTTHISHFRQAQQAGFHSFLGKPLRRDKFPEQLAQIFNGEPVWDLT
jgi:two-component system, chemotaxis family, sensor kinase CheA